MSTPSTALNSNGYVIQNPGGPKMTPLVPRPSASQPASPAAADPTQSSSLASGVKGLFGKIGAGLKAALPYLPSIANHIAAAAGSYAPLEEQHQEEELALRQQNAGLQRALAQSTLQTQELNRQQTLLGIDNYENPAQRDAREIAKANTENRNALTNANELGPGQIVASPLPTGGYGQVRVRGNNAEPIMTHSQVPNPTQAAGAGTVPPLGGMHLIPPAQSSDQATQLMALPKGMSKGQPIAGPNGQFRVPIYNAQQQIDHYETLDGTPIPAMPTSTSGLKTELKDDGHQMESVPKSPRHEPVTIANKKRICYLRSCHAASLMPRHDHRYGRRRAHGRGHGVVPLRSRRNGTHRTPW